MRGDEKSVECYPFMWREAKNIMNEDGHIERTVCIPAFYEHRIKRYLGNEGCILLSSNIRHPCTLSGD